nr:uncharacterized protein LOC129268632 [Lytechinus pictus]
MARTHIMIACILILVHVCLPVVQAVSTVEGEGVNLTFPYPCNSTEVTLQQSNRVPFYISTDGSSMSLPPDQVQRFNVQNRISTRTCSLELTITDLRRADQGTYILFVYQDGDIGDDTQIVYLKVDYPPGKASCVVGHSIGEEWVGVDCTASAGTIPGKIECYQNGIWMFPLNDPTVVDSLLKQTILILESQAAFCCSSPWHEVIDRCECNDTALFLDGTMSENPCPTIEIQISTTTLTNNVPTFESTSKSTAMTTTSINDTPEHGILKHEIIFTISLLVATIIIHSFLIFIWWQKKKNSCRNTKNGSQSPIKQYDEEISEI